MKGIVSMYINNVSLEASTFFFTYKHDVADTFLERKLLYDIFLVQSTLIL